MGPGSARLRSLPASATLAAYCAALLLTLVILKLRSGVSPGIAGALVCGALCAYAARRPDEARRVWLAFAGACLAWAALHALGGRVLPRVPMTLSDGGVFLFAAGATVAQWAWPEVRQGAFRLLQTVTDTLAVVASIALWGATGFLPLGWLVPGLSLEGLARPAALVFPLAAGIVTLASLGPKNRASARVLTAAVGALLAGELLQTQLFAETLLSREGAWVFQAGAFTTAVAAVFLAEWAPREMRSSPNDSNGHLTLLSGLVGAAGLAAVPFVGWGTPAPVGFAFVLGTCLALREVLQWREGRRLRRQFASALALGARIADVGVAETSSPRQRLGSVYQLVEEALEVDRVEVWVREGKTLLLLGSSAVQLGTGARRLSIEGSGELPARVFREGRTDRAPAGDGRGWSLAGVPIVPGGRPLGVLVLARRPDRGIFGGWDSLRADLVAAQIGAVLDRALHYTQLEARLEEANLAVLVCRFAIEAAGARTPGDIARQLLAIAAAQVPFDWGEVRLSQATPGASVALARAGKRPTAAAGAQPWRLQTSLAYGSTPIGSMALERVQGGAFRYLEEETVDVLARVGAVVLHNSRLREESQQASAYRALDHAKTHLLAGVSHDLRGALGAIKGHAEWLAESGRELEEEDQLFSLRTIGEEADRLHRMVERVLDLSVIEEGRLRLEPQAINLQRLIQQSVDLFESPTHVFECQVPDGLLVMGDRDRLREVLDNLVSNAIKYSPEGGLVKLRAEAEGDEVVIAVSDSGIGVPSHRLKRIFEQYERDDAARRLGIPGTGLGLAICKGIVEAHGGRIWVKSTPGRGSTFFFTVPRAPSSPSDMD